MFKVIMASNPEILGNPDFTVEAEYGEILVEGKYGTLAHHGSRSNNPAPCTVENGLFTVPGLFSEKEFVIGISHFDLDTLGGIFAIFGIKNENKLASEFWKLAGFVDVNGAHKISQSDASLDVRDILYSYWAYTKNKRYFCKSNETLEIPYEDIMEYWRFFEAMFDEADSQLKRDYLQAGFDFQADEERKNKDSFVEECGGAILRVAPYFTNTFYTTPNRKICNCVVSYNTLSGAITISFAEKIVAPAEYDANNSELVFLNARDFVQKFWGEKAGGHQLIAGSPRGERMKLEDLMKLWNYVLIWYKSYNLL